MSHKSPSTQAILECLRQTARETLERKRRLGQYAVIWKDGRVQKLIPSRQTDAPLLSEDEQEYNQHPKKS